MTPLAKLMLLHKANAKAKELAELLADADEPNMANEARELGVATARRIGQHAKAHTSAQPDEVIS